MNSPAVVGVADEQLGRAIPARGHVVRVYLAWFRQCSREAEIAQLDDARRTHENIFRFDVAMDDLRHKKNTAIGATAFMCNQNRPRLQAR